MRKDFILTAEEKLSKQQRLEENRRIRSTVISSNVTDIKRENTEQSPSINIKFESVGEVTVNRIINNLFL
jgi:hypothetical protein